MPRLTLLDAGNLRERGSGRSFIDPINMGACLLFLSLSPEEQGDMGWQTDVVSSRYLSWLCVEKRQKSFVKKLNHSLGANER